MTSPPPGQSQLKAVTRGQSQLSKPLHGGQSQLKAATRGPKSTRAWLSAALPRERPTALEGMPAMPPTSAAHTQPCMHAPTSAAHNHTLTFSLSLLYLILSLSLTSGKTNYTTFVVVVGVVVEGGQLVVRLLQPPRGGASPSLKPNPTRAFLVLTLQRARPTCSLGESSLAHVRHLALAVARWLRLSFRFHRNCFLSSGERVLLRIYSKLDW